MKKSYAVIVNNQKIDVSWDQRAIWSMPFNMENWRFVLDFVDAVRLTGYKVDVTRA